MARWGPEVVFLSQGSVLDLMHRGDIDRLLRAIGAPYGIVCQYNTDRPIPSIDDAARRRTVAHFERAAWVGFVAAENLRAARRLNWPRPWPTAWWSAIRSISRAWPSPPSPLRAAPGGWRASPGWRSPTRARTSSWKSSASPRSRDRDWRLRLYGRGHDRDYLEELARFYGYRRPGRVPRACRRHQRPLGGQSPDGPPLATSEGTPLAMVEAMACGRPVVATDVGGNAEWVDEPSTGFLAEAPTLRSFGAALECALDRRRAPGGDGGDGPSRLPVSRLSDDPSRAILARLVESASTAPVGGPR